MKNRMIRALWVLIMIIPHATFAQIGENTVAPYDSALAAKLGADEYGMKTYYMVFLKKGPVSIKDSIERMNIQNGHLRNIMRLARENRMIMAGPFLDNGEIRGIFVFNASSIESVQQWLKTDPAVKAGLFTTEIHPWYGPAALMKIGDIEKQVQKRTITD